jgi:hypothetical protein
MDIGQTNIRMKLKFESFWKVSVFADVKSSEIRRIKFSFMKELPHLIKIEPRVVGLLGREPPEPSLSSLSPEGSEEGSEEGSDAPNIDDSDSDSSIDVDDIDNLDFSEVPLVADGSTENP